MNFYFASKRVVESPTVNTSGSSPVVVEPSIVRSESVGNLTADPLITAAKIPKTFALFPLQGYQWQFVNVDGQNINPFTRVGNVANRTFRTNAASFIQIMDFIKIKETKHVLTILNSIQDLIELPERKDFLFLNEIKTDGYTCRLSFARGKRSAVDDDQDAEPRQKIELDLDDFTDNEISTLNELY